MTRKALDEHISSARPVRCAAASTIWSEDSTSDQQTSVPCAHHKAEIKKRRPIIKGGRSPTLHQFQFRGSRHVREMEWEVAGNIGAERAAAGPDRISLTQLPALPTRMHRFFCR